MPMRIIWLLTLTADRPRIRGWIFRGMKDDWFYLLLHIAIFGAFSDQHKVYILSLRAGAEVPMCNFPNYLYFFYHTLQNTGCIGEFLKSLSCKMPLKILMSMILQMYCFLYVDTNWQNHLLIDFFLKTNFPNFSSLIG